MLNSFDDVQKLGKDGMEAALQSLTAISKGAQTAATEAAEFTRKSFEQGTSAWEGMLGARSLERVVEVQNKYVQTAYESMMAQATKLGELYADTARQSFQPLEGYLAKVRPSA